MSKTPGEKSRLKLTARGAAALQQWLVDHGSSQVDLQQFLGLPHQTAIHRALNRTGLLTPKQVGLAAAYTYGEVGPAALVGKAAAKQVPKVAAREKPAPPQARSVPPSAADGEVDVEALARAETAANIALLREIRDDPKTSASQRLRCIEQLLEYGEGKARQRERVEKNEPPAVDTALVNKLEQLIADARKRVKETLDGLPGSQKDLDVAGRGSEPDAGGGDPPGSPGAA